MNFTLRRGTYFPLLKNSKSRNFFITIGGDVRGPARTSDDPRTSDDQRTSGDPT